MRYVICQLPISNNNKFRGYDESRFKAEDYVNVWEDEVDTDEASEATCEDIYIKFNCGQKPKHYAGHSISVSDLIVFFTEDNKTVAFFCDTVGWIEVKNTL